MTLRGVTLFCVGLLFSLLPYQAAADGLVQTVALTGQHAPGTGEGVTFQYLRIPTINNVGQIAIKGYLTGPGVEESVNDHGIWSTAPSGGLALIARQGDVVPNVAEDFKYAHLNEPTLNDRGQVATAAVWSSLDSISEDESGNLVDGNNGLVPVIQYGDFTPGLPAGNYFTGGINFRLDSKGRLSVFGLYTSGELVNGRQHRATAIWIASEEEGQVLVVREGMPAGDAAPEATHWGLLDYTSNGQGKIAFVSQLATEGVDPLFTIDQSLWVEDDTNGLNLVARTNQQAPGLPEGVTYGGFEEPVLNNKGVIAFVENHGIWVGTAPSDLALIVGRGEQAAGMPAESVHASFTNLQISDTGKIVFSGLVAGPQVPAFGNSGVWYGDLDDGFQLIGRRGGPTPENLPGLTFAGAPAVVLNDSGRIAMFANLDGPGITPANDRAIWAQTTSGDFLQIAREGDLFDVNDDPEIEDFRTIATLEMFQSTNNPSSQRTPFNSRGELVFRAEFTDGSFGIFTSRAVAVPEPASIVLLLLALTAIASRQMRSTQ